MLTRLTTVEILWGKFWAAYLPVLLVLATCIPPVAMGYFRFFEEPTVYYTSNSYGYYPRSTGNDLFPALAFLVMKSVLQAAFYVTAALVCSYAHAPNLINGTRCSFATSFFGFPPSAR